MMAFTLSVGKRQLYSIGLSLPGVIPGLRKGLIWSAGFGTVIGLAAVFFLILGIDPMQFVRTPLPLDSGHIILFFAVGGLLGPLAEEIFFRGILYGFFRRWGAPAAITLSSLAFILAHPIFSGVPVTQVVGGLLFAVAYEVEKNLMVPITIHALGNLAIFSLSLF